MEIISRLSSSFGARFLRSNLGSSVSGISGTPGISDPFEGVSDEFPLLESTSTGSFSESSMLKSSLSRGVLSKVKRVVSSLFYAASIFLVVGWGLCLLLLIISNLFSYLYL